VEEVAFIPRKSLAKALLEESPVRPRIIMARFNSMGRKVTNQQHSTWSERAENSLVVSVFKITQRGETANFF